MQWSNRLQGPLLFVGDIHGHSDRLHSLWSNVLQRVGPKVFESLNVCFLGDYCDKGEDTKGCIEWLTALGERHPQQHHVYLAGNHDFALCAFLGLLPNGGGGGGGQDYSITWKSFVPRPGDLGPELYSGPGYERMHLQGRRYASFPKSNYEAEATFRSYGVNYGDRDGLLEAMPQHHKSFFSNLQWIVQLQSCAGNFIAVHAGLEEKDVESQMEKLREKYAWSPYLEPLSGRSNVEKIPSSLLEPILRKPGVQPPPQFLVSGHHGFLRICGRRIIVDESPHHLCSVLVNAQPVSVHLREGTRRFGPLHIEVIAST